MIFERNTFEKCFLNREKLKDISFIDVLLHRMLPVFIISENKE
jgi:hypothetical protein